MKSTPSKLTTDEKATLSIAGGVILAVIIFWVIVGYVAFHFVLKFW